MPESGEVVVGEDGEARWVPDPQAQAEWASAYREAHAEAEQAMLDEALAEVAEKAERTAANGVPPEKSPI
jgi:hypothetical protein